MPGGLKKKELRTELDLTPKQKNVCRNLCERLGINYSS